MARGAVAEQDAPMLLDDDLRLAWRLSRTWPLARRLRMRAGVVLYSLGLQRLGVRVALGPCQAESRTHGGAQGNTPEGRR
jgi:hypothetical protein